MDEFVALCKRLGVASSVLNKSDVADTHRISAAVTQHCREKWAHAVTTNSHRPMLAVYQSDGWSGLTTTPHKVVKALDFVVRRVGKLRIEFLLQRAFLKVRTSPGNFEVCQRISEPLGLRKGRRAYNVFTACCEFLGLLRQDGAEDVAVSGYIFDGMLYLALRRHLLSRHELFYSLQYGPDLGSQRLLLWCLDWPIVVKCVSHAFNNASSWGLSLEYDLSDEQDKVTHITVKSLINSRDGLLEKINEFVSRRAKAVDTLTGTVEERRAFWQCLDTEPQIIELFIFFDLEWDGYNLCFWAGAMRLPDWGKTLETLLTYSCCWVSFCRTRWASIGPCGRKYSRSEACGIAGLVEVCLEDPDIDPTHMRGYTQGTAEVRALLVAAAFVPRPAETVLLEVHEDDRLLKHCQQYQLEGDEEYAYLVSLPQYVWRRLARIVGGGANPDELRRSVLQCSLGTLAYMYKDVWYPLEVEPLKHFVGNLEQNLDAIGAEPSIDLITRKIKFAKDIHVPRGKLLAGMEVAQELGFTINLSEQNHVGVANVLDKHPTVTSEVLCSRSICHQASQHMGVSAHLKARSRVSQSITRAQNAMGKTRNAYNEFIARESKASKRDESLAHLTAFERQQVVVARASGKYKEVSHRERLQLQVGAKKKTCKEDEKLQGEIDRLEEALRLHDMRAVDSKESAFVNHTDAMRFTDEDLATMAEKWRQLKRRSTVSVKSLRENQRASPQVPEIETQILLENTWEDLGEQRLPVPRWCRVLCYYRSYFGRSIWFQPGDSEHVSYYMPVIMSQQPTIAVFLVLQRLPRSFPAVDDPAYPAWQLPPRHQERFSFLPLRWRLSPFVPFRDGEPIFLYQNAVNEGERITTMHEARTLESISYILGPIVREERTRRPARHGPRTAITEEVKARLREMFPFLRESDFTSLERSKRRQRKCGGGHVDSIASSEGESDDSDDAYEDPALPLPDVEENLAQLRRDWCDKDDRHRMFYMSLRGGGWTRKHQNVDTNEARGEARKGQPIDWCDLFAWPKSVTYRHRSHGGIANTTIMAREYCRKSEYFFSLWLLSGPSAFFEYTDDMIEGYVETAEWRDFLDSPLEACTLVRIAEIRALVPLRTFG